MTKLNERGRGRPLSELDELKPKAKQRVIDLVGAAGIDVSDWANFKGGEKRAATNPKYCYDWSFVEPGRIVIVNLWHASMRERNGVVSIDLNLRESIRRHSNRGGKRVWKMRAEKLDLAIQEAAKNSLPIRVVVNDGKMRVADDPKAKASRVDHRLLDSVPWAVTSYDWDTGECTLTRGALAGRIVDQFSVISGPEAAVDRREVSELQFVRDPALRSRALERAKGRCEYCMQPGFTMADGRVFLETHHVVPLGEGGPDVEGNVAALCPNHHSEAHYGARAVEIRRTLLSQLQYILSQSKSASRSS